MTKNEWYRRITYCVQRAANGKPEHLEEIAHQLADADTARHTLMVAGYGDSEDSLLDMVAVVVEMQQSEAQRES